MFNRTNLTKKKLIDISEIKKGKQLNKEHMLPNGKYFVLNGGVEPSGKTSDWNVAENTISISEGGNSCGYVSYNREKFWSGGHNYTLGKLKVNNLYLYNYLKAKENHLKALRVGSGLPNIQLSSLKDFEVIIYNEEEQHKIGAFLSAIDDYINKLEKNRTTLILKKQHYYSCLFNKKLRFKDAKSNDFPNWTQIKLNDYGEFFKGTSYSRDDISETGKNLILYGDLFTIYDGRINDTFNKTQSSYPNEVFARPGDVLFPGSTTVDAYSLISPSTLYCESVIGGDVIVYRTSKIRPLYLTHLIIGKLKKHFSKFAQGTTIIHIYSSSLGDIEFESSTSLEEQTKLEGFFDKFDKLVKLNNEKIEKMKSLKKYYLKEIFKSTEV
jgi:type I restriction enzyme, S subunit